MDQGHQDGAAASAGEAAPVVTDRAARRIAEILAGEPAGALLRVAVKGGGCSGFQYAFNIESGCAADDFIIAANGARLAVDPVSLDFLRGARIDFVDDLVGRSFKVENPNVSSSCGCGTSFSI